ncbi:MAG: hypothetical protein IPJ19_10445 [Planctomycetes bacterium]|nr:hypothetical protein [Planctomycetota bacterium]
MNERPRVQLPRWSRIARLMLPLDLLLVGWAILLNHYPQRTEAFVLLGAAFVCFLAFLFQTVAWVTVIAFFARERAREGLLAATLLLAQIATFLAVLWFSAPALSAR